MGSGDEFTAESPEQTPAPGPITGWLDSESIRSTTPARIFRARPGPTYPTALWLELRRDHAAARDAVLEELDPARDFGADFVSRWNLLGLETEAKTRAEYLLNPELGRRLDERSRIELEQSAPAGVDLQIAISDGLSSAAARMQAPPLLPLIVEQAKARGWTLGRTLWIARARVGVLNDLGAILDPVVVVLLIGERPGLATSTGLSAYMAYHPRAGHDDSRRNLISNIHARGVAHAEAACRIARLAERMRTLVTSGVHVKEPPFEPIPAIGSEPADRTRESMP